MTEEYRKIIKFGSSSHVISLPNEWVKKNNLSKGDKLVVTESNSNELMLSSSLSKDKIVKELSIDISNKSIEYFKNFLIGAYINNYTIIRINDLQLKKRSTEIRNFINSFAGLEVIEEHETKIVVKDFINEQDVYLEATVRRIDNVIRHMLKQAEDCVYKDLINSINNSDTDVNRLSFLVQKLIKTYMDNPSLTKNINFNSYELLHYYRIVINLEYFGDEVKRVGRLFRKGNLKKGKFKDLLEYYKKIFDMYIESMTSFHERNTEKALFLLDESKKLTIEINDVLEEDTEPVDVRIVEKLKNMLNSIKRTTRISINLGLTK